MEVTFEEKSERKANHANTWRKSFQVKETANANPRDWSVPGTYEGRQAGQGDEQE